MEIEVLVAVSQLQGKPVDVLRIRYREVFGEESRVPHKQYLFRRIAWRMQAQASGGLSERARQRAVEIADDADLHLGRTSGFWSWPGASPTASRGAQARGDARLPQPGTVLTRHYQGREIQVKVLEEGFEYRAERYRSLSAIARQVTGTRWNGLLFFGLTGRRRG